MDMLVMEEGLDEFRRFIVETHAGGVTKNLIRMIVEINYRRLPNIRMVLFALIEEIYA